MEAYAIFKTNDEIVKVYFHGDDWQFVSPSTERWFSVHSDMDKEESLYLALNRFVGDAVYHWIK